MIDLAGQQIFTNKKSGEMGESQLKVRSIFLKEPDCLEDGFPGLGDVVNHHGEYVLSPKDRGNVGTLPNDLTNYLQVRPGVSSSGSVELETGGKLSPKNLSSRVRSSCKLFFSEWENLPPSQDVAWKNLLTWLNVSKFTPQKRRVRKTNNI